MKHKAGKSGFSLIEVMIAVALLMIGLVGIISLQVTGIRWLGQAKHRTIAAQLASDTLEILKTVPVDRNNSATLLSTSTGIPLMDVEGQPLLMDQTVGDGYNTWHKFFLLGPDSSPCLCIGSACASCRGSFYYLVAYGVEWGGAAGSPFIADAGGSNPNHDAWYPEIRPGANEISIEVWVGWIELDDHGPSGSSQATILEYYTAMNSSPLFNFPAAFPKRKVALRTIRRLP